MNMANEQEMHFKELTDEQLDAVNGGCNSLVNTEVCAGAGLSVSE
ncbi:MAG: class IIb bacteriocin, lactobin A/cerein 7B family [Ktedonobacteraceae bacterium]|nr:class IIb bacteriocin, lactobin A/cerein 7B family [Ktedonobacteraceae bacterium]